MYKLRFTLTLAAVLIGCVSIYGQNKLSKDATSQLEKLFTDVVGSQSTADGIFTISNTKKKVITPEEVKNFLKQKGFLIINETTQKISRFGDYYVVFKDISFINPKNYDAYIFSQLTNSADGSLNSLQARGCFFVPVHKDLYEPISSVGIIKVRTGSMEELQRLDNVRWSGNVVDGFLDGQGTGFIVDEKGEYSVIKGSFNRGLPTSSITIHKAIKDLNKDKLYAKPTVKTYNAITPEILTQNAGTKDVLLQKALQNINKSNYQQEADRIEQIYQKMRGITIDNYSELEFDDFLHDFWKRQHNTENDSRGIIPKAREMIEVWNVIYGLDLTIRKTYYGFNGWSLLSWNYEWFKKFEEYDRRILNECLEIAKQKEKSSQYGFKTFFREAYKRLEKKYTDFNNKIDADYKEYSKIHSSIAKKHAEHQEKMSHEIDWDNSKDPSGDLVPRGFFSSGYEYKEKGVIRTKALGGEYCNYNIIFDRGKNFEHYEVTYATDKIRNYLNGKNTFKSRGELIEHIVNAIR